MRTRFLGVFLIIPKWFFDNSKKITFKLPYCQRNELEVKRFIDIIESFCEEKWHVVVLWSTRSIKSLFPLKDRVMHRSCVIYEGLCSCGKRYIGETVRNSETRWIEHEDSEGKSEPAKHLRNHTEHSFTWKILSPAPSHWRKRKIFEAFYICSLKPELNNQVEHHTLSLFRHGIT